MSEHTTRFPNVPGCTCDRDDDSNDDGPIVLCDYHEKRLRHLRWDTLACLVIDYEAAFAVLTDKAANR